jgi:hypothetical protein
MDGSGSNMTQKDARSFLYGIFRDDIRESNEKAAEHGYRLYQKQVQTDQVIKGGGKYVKGFKTQDGYYEPMAAVTMAHSIQNTYHMFAFEGTFANHLNYEFSLADSGSTAVYTTNANKRFMQHSSTMQLPNYGGHYMIDVETDTLHIAEPTIRAYIETAKGDPVDVSNHSTFDGQGFISPLHALMLWHSYGGANGIMDQYGNLKTVSVQSRTGNYYKHALDRPTTQSMELMPEQRLMVEIMFNRQARPTVGDSTDIQKDKIIRLI